jgi:predicted hydrocarbon binding protein
VIKIDKSGLYYPNRIAHIYLEAMEEVMGRNGLVAALRMADLAELIDNYPPANLERAFDFADYSALNGALDEIYGPRGGRGLALRAGRASFDRGLKDFGALAGVGSAVFGRLPLGTKLRIGIPAMAKIFSQFSDQYSTVEDMGECYVYHIHKCPVCWGRTSDRPLCFAAVGLLQEGLKWLSGGPEFRVEETSCVAMGDDRCSFQIAKEPVR